jgi:CRP/FNR family transcriptional regulator, cyclic AMP receptor protein
MMIDALPRPTVPELRAIGFFGALSDEVLEHLATTLSLQQLSAGETIFREGDAGREMFVLLSGELEVLRKSKLGVEARVALLGPGDWFGEMSILDVQPRSATVRTLAPARLFVIANTDLDALYRHDVKAYALIVLNLARELSRRLRVSDGIVAELVTSVTDSYLAKRH